MTRHDLRWLLLLALVGCDAADADRNGGADLGATADGPTLAGCNSLNACLDNCRSADSCAACGQEATPLAVTLFNAFDECRLGLCHATAAGDGGVACNDVDLDPASTVPLSPSCVTCTHAAATLQSPACKAKTDACLANHP